MGRGLRRLAIFLGLVQRPGEPDPVFTPQEQRRMGPLLVGTITLFILGFVLRLTAHTRAAGASTYSA